MLYCKTNSLGFVLQLDLHESFQQARQQDKKIDDDIAGFSSSDEDGEAAGFTSASKLAHQSTAKR
jgi:hypothetical protein